MPNHVTTILTAPSHVLAVLIDEKGQVDFNRVVPMPENVFRGSLTPDQQKQYPGDLNWYDWSTNHWGTKWNAYATEYDGDETLRFDTAWSHPSPVIHELSTRFPHVLISVEYADEDLGSNAAAYTILNGQRDFSWYAQYPVPDEIYRANSERAALIKYGQTLAELGWDDE
jgi:hypothetical protein